VRIFRVDNLSNNFGVSKTFRSGLLGQDLSDASRDLATLTFDHIPDMTYNVFGGTLNPTLPLTLEVTALVADAGLPAPSLKFVAIPVRKILRIYCVSISRPGDLDLSS